MLTFGKKEWDSLKSSEQSNLKILIRSIIGVLGTHLVGEGTYQDERVSQVKTVLTFLEKLWGDQFGYNIYTDRVKDMVLKELTAYYSKLANGEDFVRGDLIFGSLTSHMQGNAYNKLRNWAPWS